MLRGEAASLAVRVVGGVVTDSAVARSSSASPPPTSEAASPRNITLTWDQAKFPTIGSFKIYRQPPFAGGPFITVPVGDPRLTVTSLSLTQNQYQFTDKTVF